MADVLDLRRTDLRSNVLENPYWITSAEMTADCDAEVALLFDFPITLVAGSLCPACYGNSKIIILEMVLEVNTIFAGGTPALIIGQHTVDLQTTLAYTDDIDPNCFVETIDGSGASAAAGLYPLHATSAYDTDRLLMQHSADYVITPTDTSVPGITASYSGGVTSGSSVLHVLITRVPVVS